MSIESALAQLIKPRTEAEARSFQEALSSAIERARASRPNLTAAYREATWGDPGFQPRDQAVVGRGKATEINWGESQVVMMRPRFVTYRLDTAPGRKMSRGDFVVVHQGAYFGGETEAPLIAADVFAAHVHEEQVEPVARRIDVIQLQMPDGAFRVFRREGTQLVEKRVEQPRNPSLIVRTLTPGGGG
jgi:hypothetical protein